MNSCRYFEQKAGDTHEERRQRGVSIHELKFHCAIRILEHAQDHYRWKSISRWDWKLGTAAHIGEEARGHCKDIDVGLPRYGNQFSWRLRAGDSLRLKIGSTLIVISTQKVWEPDKVVPIVLELYLEIPTPSVR
jgi:hypothetical protein